MYSSRYKKRKHLTDDRHFEFGDVFTVSDDLLNFPETEATGKREFHYRRWVVIASNCSDNINPLCPIVTVVPLSTRTDVVRTNDVLLDQELDAVEQDSVAMIQLLQPVLKVDLEDCKGQLRTEKKQELLVAIETHFGYSED